MGTSPSKRILVRCACGAKLGLPSTAAGHQTICPKCRQFLKLDDSGLATALPKRPKAVAMVTPPDTSRTNQKQIIKHDACGAMMRVSASGIGRTVRCPKCKAKFVALPSLPASPPASVDASDTASRSLLDDFAANEQSAKTDRSIEAGPRQVACSHCLKPVAADARLCVHCGYDKKSGQLPQRSKGSSTSAIAAATANKAADAARAAAPFITGCILSFIGALIGAALWTGIAIGTGYELGIIAWAVGGFAGFGMMIGCKGISPFAGIAAAGIAAVGIIIGKAAIFVLVISSLMADAAADTNLQRIWLAAHDMHLSAMSMGLSYADKQRHLLYDREKARYDQMSDDQIALAMSELKAWETAGKYEDPDYIRDFLIYEDIDLARQDLLPDDLILDADGEFEDVTPRKWQELYDTAVERVDRMDPDDRLEKARPIDRENANSRPPTSEETDADEEEAVGTASSLFFRVMFDWKDMIFLLLAVATAYRVAAADT